MTVYNISFIGAGNVAESLSHSLKNAGQRIVSVSSEKGESARKLAAEIGAKWMKGAAVPDNTDIVIVAVNDKAIAEVAQNIRMPENAIIAHTAGSVHLKALGRTSGAGVIYPLQTFSKGCSPDLRKVPFFVEATDTPTLELLYELSILIGAGAWGCSSENRMKLHVAAVFANNFSNFMMTAGENIAYGAGFNPSLLRPLMEETIRKALLNGPAASQTGPAVRHDTVTMNNHIELLSFLPEYKDLYRQISHMIGEQYKKR